MKDLSQFRKGICRFATPGEPINLVPRTRADIDKRVLDLPRLSGYIRGSMMSVGAQALFVGGALSVNAAVAHLVCIALGAPAYRFMGAGERMVCAVEAGSVRPTLNTLAIRFINPKN